MRPSGWDPDAIEKARKAELRRRDAIRALVVTPLVVAGVALGWHLSLWDEVVDRVEGIPTIRVVDRVVPVAVALNPITNGVEIGLEVQWASKPESIFEDLASAVAGEIAADVWPDAAKRELAKHARERWDVYAIAIPYRVSLGPPFDRRAD